jgi:hypothetical protein
MRGRAVTKVWTKAERVEHAHRRPRLRNVDVDYSPAAFLARPRGRLHPLAALILDRGLSVVQAGKHLGVDRSTLERVIAWQSPAVEPMRSRVAKALGLEADALFPEPPRSRSSFE